MQGYGNHQWLDEKGFEIKKAYVQDIFGNIYEAMLNIANAKDGRKILYAISNTKKIDEGEVLSNHDVEGARSLTVNFNESITRPTQTVNTYSMQNSENDVKFSRVTEAELLKEEQYGSNRGRDTEGFDRFSRKTEEKTMNSSISAGEPLRIKIR